MVIEEYDKIKTSCYLQDVLLDVIELAAKIRIKEEEDVNIFFYFNGIPIFVKSGDVTVPPQKIIKAVKRIREETERRKNLKKQERRREKFLKKHLHMDCETVTVEEKIKKLTEIYFFKLKYIKKNIEKSRKKKEWKELKKMES